MNNADFQKYVREKVKQLEAEKDDKRIDRIHTLEDGCKRLRAKINNPRFHEARGFRTRPQDACTG